MFADGRVVRRCSNSQMTASKKKRPAYRFDDVVIDCENFRMQKDGEIRTLSPLAFDVLILLIEHRGNVITKQELFDQIWKEVFVTDNALTRVIKEIRQAIGDKAYTPRYIETVTKRGYRFVAEVALEDSVPRQATAGAQRNIPTMAVLPFKRLASESDEYLGLGMADVLITRLSNVRQVIVRPTSAVLRYAQADQDPVAIGRELRTEFVLEGSIRKYGQRIRATVQLVSVTDGRSLWAGKFDENFTDIFAVEDSIAERVASALSLTLNSEERELLTKRYT